jgi:LPXTG-motif cell wall-anchored protein
VATTTQPAPTLPVTGPSTTALAAIGGGLVLGGATVLARLRRRRLED